MRLVFSPRCTQPGLRSSIASDARDWKCHPIRPPTHPSSCDPSVGQAGVKRVSAAYHEQEQGRSEAWCHRPSTAVPPVGAGLRMSITPVPRGKNASRGPGLVTPFRSFPTVCDHVWLECSSFGNWSLPPISSVSTIKPLRPVHCLSSYPRALRHGSFHASFCASFSLSTFSSQVGDAVCQALKGLCQPVCSPRERAYQEYYSTSRGSGDGPCEASGWAPLPGTRCRGVNNWQHLICRSTTSIHPSIHPCLHHHYPTSPTTIPNGSVQQGLPASILPPPTTVAHGSFSSHGMDEWIDGWMDGTGTA